METINTPEAERTRHFSVPTLERWYYRFRKHGLTFLLDEAHLLHPDVLGHLHSLLNYDWDSRPLLSVVLVGLPELEARLATSLHKPLLSRLHTRVHLAPVCLDDSAEYLRHRLRLAGCELFPRDAVALLHEASEGAHRELDRLA